jgi:hypothetical protein
MHSVNQLAWVLRRTTMETHVYRTQENRARGTEDEETESHFFSARPPFVLCFEAIESV